MKRNDKPLFVEKEWKRSTNGILFTLIGLALIGITLMNQPLAFWGIYKYPSYEEVPKNYVQTAYLTNTQKVESRLTRKMLPWENPGYYVGGVVIYIGVRFFLPIKRREKEDSDSEEY